MARFCIIANFTIIEVVACIKIADLISKLKREAYVAEILSVDMRNSQTVIKTTAMLMM